MRPESLEIGADEPDEVVRHMADMTERQRGWINFRPVVDDDIAVPLCTWTPPRQRRRRLAPPSVGIQHHVGRRVATIIEVPDTWLVAQDHGRRGFVANVPPDEPHERVLSWLLRAGETLCPVDVERWTADLFVIG